MCPELRILVNSWIDDKTLRSRWRNYKNSAFVEWAMPSRRVLISFGGLYLHVYCIFVCLARGNENFRAPGEHTFSFFQVKMLTGSVSVLLTSISLKITLLKLAEATRETEHRSAMHSAPSTEV